MAVSKITSPDDPALAELCERLEALAQQTDLTEAWPAEQLALCGEYGVYEWFIDSAWGGQAWSAEDKVRGYLALSSACLTTTFILTQRSGACQRIGGSENAQLQELLLPSLTTDKLFATVGVSHLTTSRRHLKRPVLRAEDIDGGYLLDGFAPWVTGACHAQYVVVAATLMEGDEATEEQLLVVVPTDHPGVTAAEPVDLVGVSASHTGQLQLDQAEFQQRWVLAGPVKNVMASGVGAGTGGHQTSTLALGLSRSAIEFIQQQSRKRSDLSPPSEALQEDFARVEHDLFSLVRGAPSCTSEQLRQRANSLVLRSTQAALAAAKGTGYVRGHPAGRWCREALFFLVWSCPQPVLSANLCELAGIAE